MNRHPHGRRTNVRYSGHVSEINVLFWIRIKCSFTSWCTEIERLPFINAGVLRGLLIHSHFTDRVNRHDVSPPVLAARIFSTLTKGRLP
jgi:hypothetical protein